jgi:glycosyltransferase involved in cell wall biosynthesis
VIVTPRVSVVVPAYNSVAFIDATVRSILAQTFGDFELVISDHSSTDGTWEALQRFAADPRVRLSRLPAGGGAPANFNAVTALATGEFVKLVCGDDLLLPECLAEQVAALDAHPSAVMAASRRQVIDATGALVMGSRGLAGLTGEVDGRKAIRRTMVGGTNIFGEPAAVLLRRSVLAEVGGWDDQFPYLIDQATYCAMLLRGNLVAVPKPLAAFRVSASSQWSEEQFNAQREHSIEFSREFAAAHPGLLSRRHLVTGAMRTRANAYGRRALYRWLDRRGRFRVGAGQNQRGSHG